jgi:outer membrane protein
MSHNIPRLGLTLALLAIAPLIAQAQEGLVDIYSRALANDPVIRQAEANYLATSEVKALARSGLLPALSFSASASDNTTINPNPPLDFETGFPSVIFSSSESESESTNLNLNLSQTVFDWGTLLSLKQADKTIARAEADLASARQDLLLRTAEAYFNVLAAEDLLAAEISSREAIGQQLEQSQRRFEVGLIAITDVQEAQAGYDQQVAAVIAAERTLATSHEILREIINAYVTELKTPIENLPLLTPDPTNVEAWVDIAQGQNLSLVATRLSAEIAQDDVKISRSARFPTLRLSASSSDNASTSSQTTNLFAGGAIVTDPTDSDRESESISLNLQVPIYNGGSIRANVQQSVYRQRAAIEQVELVSRQVERQIRDAYLGVTSEISRVQALRQALESARTALRASQAGFEVDQRTTVDVLAAQSNLRRAETSYALARYDYILNVLRLKSAAGTLTEDDLMQIEDWLQ